ncbi:MAG: glycosyltransferase family 2 protein [Clostridia bacterium]|nr:glycosyltransferase family 2 protein [Clostridia bacterium]
MLVSIGIIAYNEEKNIGKLFDALLKQDYPKERTELLLVDGKSSDGTRGIMERFLTEHGAEYAAVRLFDNEKRVQPAAWKIVVEQFDGDILLRLDAHAVLPEDFVSKNVACIESGESVCGGVFNKVAEEGGSELMQIAETSMFGSGIARYRNEGEKREYVRTVGLACYKREVFETVGNFNEEIIRAEDNELHHRVTSAGYKICFDPSIRADYMTRSTLKGMLKQKFGNGRWVGVTTLAVSPGVFSIYHFVPFAFVCALILSIALAVFGIVLSSIYWAIPFFAVAGSYCLVAVLLSLLSVRGRKKSYALALPGLFFLLHCAYGVGTLVGVFDLRAIVRVKRAEKNVKPYRG